MGKFIYCAPPQASVPKTVYLNKGSCMEYSSLRTKLCFQFTEEPE